ncbi:MAG: four helix bundle protein [Bacteroidetes bacterium]|nr:four helix bundle protein [Bacteroidota bacterium]
MALYYDLPVFKDVYQLILKNFDYTKDFPREYKFTLGQDLKRDGINLVRSIYRANKSKEKTPYLEIYNTTVISNLKSLNVDQLTSALQNHKKLKIKI